MKADNAVQASQDELKLLTARFDVRRAELDALGQRVHRRDRGAEERARRSRRRSAGCSSSSRTRSRAPPPTTPRWRCVEERRHKAQLAMQRAQSIIDNLVVKAPIDGVVSVKENRDGQYFFFSGMVLPEYREGDTTSSGRNVADVIETGRWKCAPRSTESRSRQPAGRPDGDGADRRAARDGPSPPRSVPLSASASRGSFFETSAVRQFDISLDLEHPDPAMRAGSSLRLTISTPQKKARQ